MNAPICEAAWITPEGARERIQLNAEDGRYVVRVLYATRRKEGFVVITNTSTLESGLYTFNLLCGYRDAYRRVSPLELLAEAADD